MKANRYIWWFSWTVLFGHLLLLPLFLGISLSTNVAAKASWLIVAFILPLFVTATIRWLVLPNIKSVPLRFSISLASLILIEMDGLISLFLRRPDCVMVYWLCVVGMLQFAPFLDSMRVIGARRSIDETG